MYIYARKYVMLHLKECVLQGLERVQAVFLPSTTWEEPGAGRHTSQVSSCGRRARTEIRDVAQYSSCSFCADVCKQYRMHRRMLTRNQVGLTTNLLRFASCSVQLVNSFWFCCTVHHPPDNEWLYIFCMSRRMPWGLEAGNWTAQKHAELCLWRIFGIFGESWEMCNSLANRKFGHIFTVFIACGPSCQIPFLWPWPGEAVSFVKAGERSERHVKTGVKTYL